MINYGLGMRLRAVLLAASLTAAGLTACGSAKATDTKTESAQETASEPAAEAELTAAEVSEINVALEGGSGKASVASPAEVRAENGGYIAVIRWSSSNYDYMVVDGERYEPISMDGGSTFEIPIPKPPCRVEVQADTTAMSTPHLIDYTLVFGEESASEASEAPAEGARELSADPLPGLAKTGSLDLAFAEQFSADYYEGDLVLVTIPEDGSRFLLVPEGSEAPENLAADVSVIKTPAENVYMASSSDMDFYAACKALPDVRFTSFKGTDWARPEVKEAMTAASNSILYVGKYSAPDYETILAEGCGLAIENTMIYHAPEVREMLASFGIPVLVDRSSYETTPEGRMEWVKLYGLITGHTAEAEEAFAAQLAKFESLKGLEETGKTAAFFYINTNGAAVVRTADDYIPALIEKAGGTYAFENLARWAGSHSATTTMEIEAFYAGAREADYFIYSSDIPGELAGLSELLEKCPVLADCRAVREGHVFATTGNLFQSVMEMGDFVTDVRCMLTEEDPDMTFLYRLE